jgi:hypothetical protein
MLGNSLVAEQLAASQEGLRYVELVSPYRLLLDLSEGFEEFFYLLGCNGV